MGADLIGYFAKGPRRLRVSDRKVFLQVKKLLGWYDKVIGITSKEPSVPMGELRLALREYPGKDTVRSIDVVGFADEFGWLVELSDEAVMNLVKEFRETWSWRTPYRDMSIIIDPDDSSKQIMFAGEMTWGDTPSGLGFTLLDNAAKLCIAEFFGVHISKPFATIIFR